MERTTRSQLREGDRLWGGRLLEICQLTDRNSIEGLKGGLSVHNFAKVHHSALGVNGVAGQKRFWCLPTEVSSTCGTYMDTAFEVAILQMIDEKSAEAIVSLDENEEQVAHPKKINGYIHS